MSLPRDFNCALKKKAGIYAAWFPVTTPFQIGDYGLIQNGVFQKIGHLDDLRDDGFNIKIRSAVGKPVSIDFLTKGVKTIKTVASATGAIPELPTSEISAKLTYEFNKKNSFVVKAAEMTVEQMENIHQVAEGLARLRREKKWSHRFRIVSKTYTGQSCVVLLANEAGTKVEFEATANALKQIDLGIVELKPTVSFSSDTILKVLGKTGTLGLNLFKLKMFNFGGSDVKLLKSKPLEEGEKAIEEDWGEDLQDDEL